MSSDSNTLFDRRSFVKSLLGGVAGGALGLAALNETLAASGATPMSLPPMVDPDEKFWQIVRQQFLLTTEKIYMNTGGLGPSPRVVVDTLFKTTLQLEEMGEHEHHLVYDVNKKAAKLLGAAPEEIALTRNTTEGMNIVARGLLLKKGDEVLMSTHEHVGGAIPWLALANDIGVKVKLFEPGMTQKENLDIIKKHLTRKTRVLSISHIPCTVGLVFPVNELTHICRENNIFYVLDGAHPPGMIPVNLHEIGCDFYASSGHKWLLGPKGTGILYVRKEMFEQWRPTYVGAYSGGEYDLDKTLFTHKHEANATEYGTRNTALSLALGAAIDFIDTIGQELIAERGKAMASYFMREVQKMQDDVKILTPTEDASRASIVTIKPKNISYSKLQGKITQEGNIRLRGVGEHHIDGIRCSFHVFNNFEEVDKLLFYIRKFAKA
ncbi:aminotransferase class V-fold PLP-dependent enzyme [candidate division KSB1 bacterium]|nr:aminotransferase class V-fold PLP-dependent enzyme [candidate division KSB1 bacterium]